MSWLLNIIYAVGMAIVSPWLVYRVLFQAKSRRGWSQKLWGAVPQRTGSRKCVWFHAVSVGEVNLLSNLIDNLLVKQPDIDIFISTSTENGFDLAQTKYGQQHQVFFCPMDFSWAINRTLLRIRPDMLVLTELELWPNMIRCTARFGAAIVVANARLSESSFKGYRRLRFLFGPVLSKIQWLAVQNETYAERFKRLGCVPSRICVTGNVKFDNAVTNRLNPKTLRLKKLLPADPGFIFLAGSTQIEEDEMAIAVFKELSTDYSNLRLILVPRHPERSLRISALIRQYGLECLLRSQLNEAEKLSDLDQTNRILVVDKIGELGGWWGLADVGLVGGSFGSRGGQNMIEPAAFGIPVCFGPSTENFRAVVDQLLEANAAEVVCNREELTSFVRRSLNNAQWSAEIGNRARSLILQQQGATDRTIDGICRLLDRNSTNRSQAA